MKTNTIIKNFVIVTMFMMTSMGYGSNYCALVNNSGVDLYASYTYRKGFDLPAGQAVISFCLGFDTVISSAQNELAYAINPNQSIPTSIGPVLSTTQIGQQVISLTKGSSTYNGTTSYYPQITQTSKLFTFTNNQLFTLTLQIASNLSNGAFSASNIPSISLAPGASITLSLNPGTDSLTASFTTMTGYRNSTTTGTLPITSDSKTSYSIVRGNKNSLSFQ